MSKKTNLQRPFRLKDYMDNRTYAEKLKDPRWQRKRLEIMERDNFQCQRCLDKESSLTVHHKWYEKETNPWDYVNQCYVTLCELCHDNFHSFFEHENDIRSKVLGINKTDLFLFEHYLYTLIDEQGYNSFIMLNKTLLSMIIKPDDL